LLESNAAGSAEMQAYGRPSLGGPCLFPLSIAQAVGIGPRPDGFAATSTAALILRSQSQLEGYSWLLNVITSATP
jgi:hypothetical protein